MICLNTIHHKTAMKTKILIFTNRYKTGYFYEVQTFGNFVKVRMYICMYNAAMSSYFLYT